MNLPLGSATGLLEKNHFLGENIQGNGRVEIQNCENMFTQACVEKVK
jgi:hypothetical protein